MAHEFIFSTTGYTFIGKTTDVVIEVCTTAGLSGIEGVDQLFSALTEGELDRTRAEYATAGLSVDSFHLPFERDHDIAAFYETTRRGAVETMIRHMEVAAAIGARVVIQHPSTSSFNLDADGLDAYLLRLDRSFSELLPRAQVLGLTIAVENMLPGYDGPRLGSSPDHITAFAKRFGHPNLGFCLDTGHALVAGGPERAHEFADAMGTSLAAFHLADNAGDRDSHLAPGRGLVDFAAVFRGAAGIGYAHPMCIEAPPFAHLAGGSFPLAAWQALVAETRAIAERAVAE